ncbi:MAG: hypothetical protein ACK4ND_02610, partial [Cytophagaceae bacterium]
ELVFPNSPAAECFKKGDEIVAINQRKVFNNADKLIKKDTTNSFVFFRNNQLISCEISQGSEVYFSWYSVKPIGNPTSLQKENLHRWLGDQ